MYFLEKINTTIHDQKPLWKEMLSKGYIRRQKHPQAPYYIYNYTHKTQAERCWNPATLQARGLITNQKGEVVARPLPKFFNWEELSQIPTGDYEVFEKLDGSLGILYFWQGQPHLATRGSFTSAQAQYGTALLHTKYAEILPTLNPQYTYLFEIIYPENRIVVDYGAREELVLLAVLNTQTGEECPHTNLGFPQAKSLGQNLSLQTLKKANRTNEEGYIIRFNTGQRFKIKFEAYLELHRIVSGLSTTKVWAHLATGKPLIDFLENIPDEFYPWIRDFAATLESKYIEIEHCCQREFKIHSTRKTTAQYFLTHGTYPQILFAMLDQKKYSSIIWKLLEPKYRTPFCT